MFTPFNVQVPAPVLISDKTVGSMMLVILPLPAPVTVNAKPPPTIVPAFVRFRTPASEEMVEADPSVTNPP